MGANKGRPQTPVWSRGLIATFWLKRAPGFWWSVISAVLAVVVGARLIGWPISGAMSLTRAAETRNRRLAGYRLPLHAGLAWRPGVADMARIGTEPSCRDRLQSHFRKARLDSQHRVLVAHSHASCRNICCNGTRRASDFENVVFGACVQCHSDASMYSDCQSKSLSVASAVALARRLTASACTVDSLAAGWIRGPPRCAHAQSASSLRHRSHGIRSARFACATTQTTNAAFSDFPSHV